MLIRRVSTRRVEFIGNDSIVLIPGHRSALEFRGFTGHNRYRGPNITVRGFQFLGVPKSFFGRVVFVFRLMREVFRMPKM